MDEIKYTYQITPFKPIRQPGMVPIVRGRTDRYTKEQVKLFMQYGPVYRVFPDSGLAPIRVTGSNLDRLHNDKYYSEEEWETLVNSTDEGDTTVEEDVQEIMISEEQSAEIEPEPVPEVISEEEVIPEDVIEPTEEEPIPAPAPKQIYTGQGNGKHHNKNHNKFSNNPPRPNQNGENS